MNIFTYIASNDEDSARAICNKYGYAIQNANTPEDMGVCLEQLVSEVGEPAMIDIYSIHPDKDQLVSLYGQQPHDDCGCKKSKGDKERKVGTYIDKIANSNTQIQLCIIAATILLSAAIISSANSK